MNRLKEREAAAKRKQDSVAQKKLRARIEEIQGKEELSRTESHPTEVITRDNDLSSCDNSPDIRYQISEDQIQISETETETKPDQNACVSDCLDFESLEPSKPTEPSSQSSPVNPQVQAEPLSQVKPTVEDKYSAARNFLPEQIKNNPTLRADLIMRTGGYKFPELIAAGLEAIWIGPGYADFEPGVVAAAQQYLKSIEKPSEQGHALTYLKNLMFQSDWIKLENLLKTSRERASRQSAPPSPAPVPVSAAPKQLSPEELEARRKGIQIARSRFKNGAA